MRVRDRGTILLAVLVVITISALAGTTAMYFGEAASSAARVSLKRTRSRALAWSGIQAVMAELADQRDKILDSENPLITTQWQLFEESGKRGIVRLVALDKDSSGQEQWVTSEGAKLDLNSATSDMLAKIPPLTKELADAIVAARGDSGQGFCSVEELVRVPGIKPEMLYGASDESDTRTASPAADTTSLSSVLGVFAFDPNIQAGIDPGGADQRGKLRVNLDTPWSDELGDAIKARFGQDAVAPAQELFKQGQQFKSVADLCGVLKRLNLQSSAWPIYLDVFSCSPDPYIAGRVDLNRASAAVLSAIPGISADAAAQIVQQRQGLDAATRRTVTWPLSHGILKEDEFLQAVDHLTTRSMQWRVRVEVGLIDSTAAESASRDPALEDRMAFEAVIDIGSERPRIAYLRDVTMMDAAKLMDRTLAAQADRRESPAASIPEVAAATSSTEQQPAPTEPSPTPPSAPTGFNMDSKLKFSGALNFGGDRAGPETDQPVPDAPPPPDNAVGPPSPTTPAEGVDRRIGRWNSHTPGSPAPTGGTGP